MNFIKARLSVYCGQRPNYIPISSMQAHYLLLLLGRQAGWLERDVCIRKSNRT